MQQRAVHLKTHARDFPGAWMRAVSASLLLFMDAGAAAASDREPPGACSSSKASVAAAEHERSLSHE
jgi:hypothetical protein